MAQAANSSDPQYLLYDGQGSVRHHSDSSGDLVSYSYDTDSWCDTFSYDAYGHRIDPLADTVNEGLFYTGEQWDNSAQSYYLRARYYDPLNGRFNRMDPFSGNLQDPQSLHKYLYAHCNPINGIDPSGTSLLTNVAITMTIGGVIMALVGAVIFGIGLAIKNDFTRYVGLYTFILGLALITFGASLGAGYGVIGAKHVAGLLITLPMDVCAAYLAYLAGKNAHKVLRPSDLKAFIDYYAKAYGLPMPKKGAILWRDHIHPAGINIPEFDGTKPRLLKDETVLMYEWLPQGNSKNFHIAKYKVVG